VYVCHCQIFGHTKYSPMALPCNRQGYFAIVCSPLQWQPRSNLGLIIVRTAHMLSLEWNKAWNRASEQNGTVNGVPDPLTPTLRAAHLDYTLKNSWAVSLTVVWTPQRPPQDNKTVLYKVAIYLFPFPYLLLSLLRSPPCSSLHPPPSL
jgi:hypothetical protein